MAKANQRNKKVPSVKQMNVNFDQILATFEDVAAGTKEIMPLFSKSVEFSIDILKMYKQAFNSGTKYVK